jgi:hypothetical protein
MSTDASSVHADLAYLKSLVEGDSRRDAAFGAAYLVAGVAYGIQVILQWLAYAEILPIEGTPIYLVVVTVPTLVLIGFTTWQSIRARKLRAPNSATRAIDAVFTGAGLANVVVIIAIVAAAVGLSAYAMIMVYAAVIFAFQGACWFVVYRLRRRTWMLAVALGWLLSGIGLGFALGAYNIHAFIAIAAFDIWVLMALPGALILLNARRAAS